MSWFQGRQSSAIINFRGQQNLEFEKVEKGAIVDFSDAFGAAISYDFTPPENK